MSLSYPSKEPAMGVEGDGGQGWLVRVVAVATLPPPPAARPPQPRVAGSSQLPRGGPPSPPLDPMSLGQRPPSPPPRWQRPAPSAPTLFPSPPHWSYRTIYASVSSWGSNSTVRTFPRALPLADVLQLFLLGTLTHKQHGPCGPDLCRLGHL